ncbi:hypothetical protein BJ875DRAFT_7810 [Amylocarpus encephaloides]|uniref:Uncharacterized protein n=1 Tax=Amylocarpus encephaloides TaxID=45428 RepID=A0A9P8C723_9HELO|nr:hypothetical protein BJ875DRAFT_7810 [Amylocarpus encephaloides]
MYSFVRYVFFPGSSCHLVFSSSCLRDFMSSCLHLLAFLPLRLLAPRLLAFSSCLLVFTTCSDQDGRDCRRLATSSQANAGRAGHDDDHHDIPERSLSRSIYNLTQRTPSLPSYVRRSQSIERDRRPSQTEAGASTYTHVRGTCEGTFVLPVAFHTQPRGYSATVSPQNRVAQGFQRQLDMALSCIRVPPYR